ncbi:MAG: SH3 domain-containing protein [Salinarimonas sp.]|nr:SH3 domain-containing protein [Salinarimonas sp.]
MIIRPDARKRISSLKFALAFGLAPMLLPALSGSESGLIVTPAQAADCAETRHITFRAERPPGNGLVTYMPEVSLTDDHIFQTVSGTRCGPYDRVTGFQLMSSQSSVMTMPPRSYNLVHTDVVGDRFEAGLGSWPDSDGATDVFNGRDPRGLWQVARVPPPGSGSGPGTEHFRLTLGLADDAQVEPAVVQAEEPVDEEESTASGDLETPTTGTGGTSGAASSSSGATGGGTVAVGGSGSNESEPTEEPMISPEPWIAEDEDETASTLGSKLLDAMEQAGFGDHPQMQPLFPLTQPELFFGPEEADPDGYLVAPTTVPVGSRVPIILTYDDRRHFDNLILVKADAPDSAVGRNVGRNSHLVGDDEVVHRRVGDTPGTYELRLRRHENFDRRIMARKQIEVIDIDVDLQMREEVTAREDFDVFMNPVMDGHLYVTTPDRDHDDLINRNAQRQLGIEEADGPGLFTRTAPRGAGEYELRFNFNPSPRWSDVMGREGRLMARVPFRVVDAPAADNAAADEAEETAKLEELEAKITALSEDLEEVTVAQTEGLRDEISALGLPALAMLIAMLDRNAIAPELAFAITAPAPPTQWGAGPGAMSPVAPAAAAATPVAPMAQPQPVQPAPAAGGGAVASSPVAAGSLSAQDERRIIMLITRLNGVVPEEQQPIIDELAEYGPAATDILIEMMQEGLIYRPLALRAAAAIEPDGEAPAPQAQMQPAAQQPSGYQVIGVAPDDMLNVRDRAGVSGSTVIGQLAPDARDVVRSGDVQNVGGRDWWHVRHPTLPQQGGWVNSRFLSAEAGLAAEELSYRVIGVALDDALNIRSFPGTDGEIIARASPDAEGLRWNGQSAAVAGATWWELVHPDLPGNTGWVNSRFLEAQEGVAVTSVAPPRLEGLQPPFTEAEGYATIEADPTVNRLLDTLPQTSSIFPPGNEFNPLTKAVLLLENEEGVADHARYRIRYGLERRHNSLGGPPVPFSFVQVDRFNLGEVFREAIAESFGEARTPPPEAFGAGEHVSYRFEFRPIQGRVADLVAASRQVIPDAEAQGMECLTLMCLHLGSVGEGSMTWRDDAGRGTGFDRPYEDIRNGVYTPATMMDLLTLEIGVSRISDGRLIWSGFEESESVRPGEPFMETILDVNLAQDYGIEAVLRWGNLMDDSVAAIWSRAMTFPSGDAEPHLATERFFECARGEPGAEGLCP